MNWQQKSILTFTILLLCFNLIYSRETINQATSHFLNYNHTLYKAKNNFNLNISGNASFISVQYERLHFISPKYALSFGLGLGYAEEPLLISPRQPDKYINIPLHITFNLIKKEKHFFFFGIGRTTVKGDLNKFNFYYPILGYRMRPTKRFNFGPFLSFPFWQQVPQVEFIPIGFSFGLSF